MTRPVTAGMRPCSAATVRAMATECRWESRKRSFKDRDQERDIDMRRRKNVLVGDRNRQVTLHVNVTQ